jgi:CheY-like chemotaxis protein
MLEHIAERAQETWKANADLQREIEERRRIEEERTAALARERDANRLKDEFLATLSHELRTPLNAVLGWARVLRMTAVDDGMRSRGLEAIERNARAQARLIEDLLEISRIVTGKLRLVVREVDLAAIVDTAVEIVRPAAVAKRLQMHVEVAARPAMTIGDPDRLQQVIWNLVSNAVKFTPADGRIVVRLKRENGYVLTVEDSGLGIEPRFLPHVFEMFRQADGSATREHGGLGLGLAIARQLIEAHGGTIRAHSEGKDRGATFEVSLPSVAPAPHPRTAADGGRPAAPAAFDPSLLRGVHILVVDDDDDARELLRTTLGGYGAKVTSAASAGEALAAVDRNPPDIVLCDIGMPQQDGYDFMRAMRSRPASRGGSIPAVAVTAYASAADRAATEAAGYVAHIAKPVDPTDVAHVVKRLLATSKL